MRSVLVMVLGAAAVLVVCGGSSTSSADPERTQAAASNDKSCPEGMDYIPEVDWCFKPPYHVDLSPGAFGCDRGGVRGFLGDVTCVP